MQGSASTPGGNDREGSVGDTLAALRSPNFYPYLIGNVLSNTGTWFQVLAQALLIYRLTGSTFLLGVIGFCSYAGVLVLAPWAGSAADRFDRRRLMIVTQLASAAIAGTLALVTALGAASPAVLIAFALGLSITNAFWTPTLMAFVPSLVEERQLPAALALNSVSFNLGRVIGPLLAVLLIETLGPAWAFGLNAASFLAVVAGLLRVHPLVAQLRPSTRPRLRESLRLVIADPRLGMLLLAIAAMNLATDPVVALGPAFAREVFGRSDTFAGVLIGAFGIGAVVAAFTIAHRLHGSRVAIVGSLVCTGLSVAAFALSPTVAVGLVFVIALGYSYLAANTAATTRLQLDVSPEHRGRIMALWAIAFNGVRPVGSIIDGAVASWIGVRSAGVLMAVPALVVAGMFFTRFGRERKRTVE